MLSGDWAEVVEHLNSANDLGGPPMPEDPHPVFPWLTAPRRKWLYGVLTAANPLLVVWGLVAESSAPLVVGLVAAVLGTGVATAHTASS